MGAFPESNGWCVSSSGLSPRRKQYPGGYGESGQEALDVSCPRRREEAWNAHSAARLGDDRIHVSDSVSLASGLATSGSPVWRIVAPADDRIRPIAHSLVRAATDEREQQ